MLFDQSHQELMLVVKLTPETLFMRQIVREPLSSRFRLEFNSNCFDTMDSLLDFYHENFLYDWTGSTLRRLKMKRAVYNRILSLQYFAGVALKRKQLSIPYPHLQSVISSTPKHI